VSLKTKILFIFIFIGLSLKGQSFMYNYIDPCTKEIKTIYADMSAPIMVSYYGQTQAFTYQQLQDGSFDAWMSQTYTKYKGVNPCQGLITTTTTTTSTNLVANTIGLVMNLNSITNLDFSNIGRGVGTDVAGNTSSGSGSVKPDKPKKENQGGQNSGTPGQNTGQTGGSVSGSTNNTGSTGSQGSGSSGSGDNPGSQGSSGDNSGSNGSQGSGSSGSGSSGSGSSGSGSSGSGSSGSGDNSGSGSSSGPGSSSGGSGSGSGSGKGTPEDQKKPDAEKIEETKQEEQKNSAGQTTKAANRSKTETQKPAILVTGDIVGIQSASSSAQDARATSSFTRVKGDGTASLGGSLDYTFNAKIGNITLVRSWIGTNKKGNKHINVLSDGISLMPGTLTNTLLFVRVNSLKNFTALYGGAATYGKMYGEELISTLTVGGFMYKGKLTKKLNGTFIAAAIYSPYSKYYTESFLESKPIIIPFMNLTYQMTKTFGFGLTGGGTYIAGQDILNYQVLMGAKLIL
jgi:hypothetical protein